MRKTGREWGENRPEKRTFFFGKTKGKGRGYLFSPPPPVFIPNPHCLEGGKRVLLCNKDFETISLSVLTLPQSPSPSSFVDMGRDRGGGEETQSLSAFFLAKSTGGRKENNFFCLSSLSTVVGRRRDFSS